VTACSITVASQGLATAILNTESSVIVCIKISVLDGADATGTALQTALTTQSQSDRPMSNCVTFTGPKGNALWHHVAPALLWAVCTEVVKVMTNKLLNLTAQAAQHCSMQSTPRPIHNAP